MKLVLCRCKTVNKKRTMNNTIDNYFSQYTSSRQGGERMCQRHVHLYSSVSPHILRTRNRQETIACTHNYRGVPISGQGGLAESVSPHTLRSRNQKNSQKVLSTRLVWICGLSVAKETILKEAQGAQFVKAQQ